MAAAAGAHRRQKSAAAISNTVIVFRGGRKVPRPFPTQPLFYSAAQKLPSIFFAAAIVFAACRKKSVLKSCHQILHMPITNHLFKIVSSNITYADHEASVLKSCHQILHTPITNHLFKIVSSSGGDYKI